MHGDNFHSELLVLLKNAHDDIESTKQMGWRDFYNILIAIGAVTGLYRAVYIELNIQWMHHLFFLVPSALMVLGFWLIWASQETLQQQRNLVTAYCSHLDKDIQNTLDSPLGKSANRSLYPQLYTAVIAVTAVFGTLVMIGLRFSQPC
jgi:hypothetical protein